MSDGRLPWLRPDDPPEWFPRPEAALDEPNGLLAAGGDLTEARLLAAYTAGIFPWYEAGQPILWWSPTPRCVLKPGELRVSRRMRQYARRSPLVIRFNTAFSKVIRRCAEAREVGHGTWITAEMIAAYEHMHDRGWAHSIEIYDADRLVGGLYGLCIGRVFFGESMFSRASNASKFALLGLSAVMLEQALELLDCQVVSRHLLSLGASRMPRTEFCHLLEELCRRAVQFRDWPDDDLPVADALQRWLAAALQ